MTLSLLIAIALGLGQPDPGYGPELPEGAAGLDFVIVNRSDRAISGVSIRPSGEGSPWSDDVLVPDQLPAGERGAVSYTRDIELCRWDIRVTFEGGAVRDVPRVDLCRTLRVEVGR